jgi:hypothetical protein
MKLSQIEESVRKLRFPALAGAQDRILADALEALAGANVSAIGRGLGGLRILRRSLPIRLAGAAAIIAIAFAGARYMAWRVEGCSDTTALTIELASKDISRFFGI